MAIPKDLEPLIEGFTAEERTLFDNLLTKQATTARARDANAPTLADGWLRQSDYDRKMNLSKDEIQKAKDRARQLEDWYAENEPIHRASLDRARELESRNAEIMQQLDQARTQGGGDVDAVELERRVQAEVAKLKDTYGYVTKTDIGNVIKQETEKLTGETKKAIDDATKQYYEVAMPQGINLAADIAEICVDHKSEFNERLDRKKFAEYMQENKLVDPVKAYEQYVKPRRDEIEFKKKVDEEVKQRLSGMTVNGGMPGAGSPLSKGVIQMKVEKDQAAAGISTTVAATQAAAELRQEGRM